MVKRFCGGAIEYPNQPVMVYCLGVGLVAGICWCVHVPR